MITLTDNDDSQFIALASRLVDAAITIDRPAEVYLIRIDHWFDAKWLKFSGKAHGAVGIRECPTTVPPFHPHRVLSESHFAAAPDSDAFTPTSAPPLHIAQRSSENLTRSVSAISQSAVFFWYSGSTLVLDRGSTMLYRIERGEVSSWYASFHRNPTWRLDRHRGISPTEVHHLLGCAETCSGREEAGVDVKTAH